MSEEIREFFPYRDRCQQCAAERGHHHHGEHTIGMLHEGGGEYCWCLDQQEPMVPDPLEDNEQLARELEQI